MSEFRLRWTGRAVREFSDIEQAARESLVSSRRRGKAKASRSAGPCKQIIKTLCLLRTNRRHPGLQTHEFHSLSHPWDSSGKVFEAYAQNRTPGAYRLFWCYGPEKGSITIIAITPHP